MTWYCKSCGSVSKTLFIAFIGKDQCFCQFTYCTEIIILTNIPDHFTLLCAYAASCLNNAI